MRDSSNVDTHQMLTSSECIFQLWCRRAYLH